MQNYNFTWCFVWMLNLDSHIKTRTQIVGLPEQGTKENILTVEEWYDKRLDKTV